LEAQPGTPPLAAQPDYGTDKTKAMYFYGIEGQAIDILSPTDVSIGIVDFPLEVKKTPGGGSALTQSGDSIIHTTGPNTKKIGYKLSTILRRNDSWFPSENAFWHNDKIQIAGNLKHPKNGFSDIRDVPSGQYEIRITLKDSTTSKRERSVYVDFFEEHFDRPDVYQTHQYFTYTFSKDNQGKNKVDIETQSKTRVWDTATNQWLDDQPTSNPAWWLYDLLRGKYVNGELIYGFGYNDSQLDLESFKAWATFCENDGLEVNYVVPPNQKRSETLSVILACGRDVDITNIVGGLEIQYIKQKVKKVEGEFFDAVNDYRPQTIRVDVAGGSAFESFEKVDLIWPGFIWFNHKPNKTVISD